MRNLKTTAAILLLLYIVFLVMAIVIFPRPLTGEFLVVVASFKANWLLASLALFILIAVVLVHAGNLLYVFGNWRQKQFVVSRFWWYWAWVLVIYLLLINPHVQYFLLSLFFGDTSLPASQHSTNVASGTIDAMKQWWHAKTSQSYNLLYIAENMLIMFVLLLYALGRRQHNPE